MNRAFKFFLCIFAGILGIALGALVLLHLPNASFAVDPDTVSTAPFFTSEPPPWSKIISSPEWEKLSPEQKGIVADKWYRACFDYANSLGRFTADAKKQLYDFYQKAHAEAVTVPLGLAIFRLFPGVIHFVLGASLLAGGIAAFWRASHSFALGKLVQERIASGNSLSMHFLGQLVLAFAIVIAAIIIACAFRYTPVTERAFGSTAKPPATTFTRSTTGPVSVTENELGLRARRWLQKSVTRCDKLSLRILVLPRELLHFSPRFSG